MIATSPPGQLASLAGLEPASPPSDGSACSSSARATPKPGSAGGNGSAEPTCCSAALPACGPTQERIGYRTQIRTGSLRLRTAALCLLSYAAAWLREQDSNLHLVRLTGACPTNWAIPQHQMQNEELRIENRLHRESPYFQFSIFTGRPGRIRTCALRFGDKDATVTPLACVVGAAGFEPAVTAFRRRDVAQATPHPDPVVINVPHISFDAKSVSWCCVVVKRSN